MVGLCGIRRDILRGVIIEICLKAANFKTKTMAHHNGMVGLIEQIDGSCSNGMVAPPRRNNQYTFG